MIRRCRLLLVGPATAMIASAALAAAAPRPNVLVILTDDQGWGDLAINGHRQLSTPHLDSLARDGVTLDRFFVQPVCSPTRAEFLTGRWHLRGGVTGVSTGQERLNADERTIAEAFRAAGYATACFGKWHNGGQWPYHPNARGFDEFYGFTEGHWGVYIDPPLEHNGRPVRGRGFIVDDLTDRAIEFCESHRDRPWLVYLAINTPHSPFIVPRANWERWRNRPIELRGPDGDHEPLDVTRAVLAMVENVDENVGRLLAALDRSGQRERTIVVFFSDNGPNSSRWNGGMKGRKGSTDEGGVRSPCFIRWSGTLPAGRVVTQICAAVDLLPTLTALAGIPHVGERPLDGRDLSPLLRGEPVEWGERVLFAHWGGRVSVRTDRYRLDADGALFDMWTDPGQTRDRRAELPEVAARLEAALDAWRRDVGLAPPDSSRRARRSPLPVDHRPHPIGYAECPRTFLPAKDGVPSGTVARSSSAPNCSYFVNWTSTADRITYDVEVVSPGEYEVELWYTCAPADAGSVVEVSCLGAALRGRVEPAWDPPLITDQDVIPRPREESFVKDFRPLGLGRLRLPAGRGPLVLRALSVAGREVMHLRGVALTLRQP
ncbi:MAG: arylsulfatase [Kiritimatiellae bacterium]|nr:arylsulfatase [Kiritimatiellia bacterium]